MKVFSIFLLIALFAIIESELTSFSVKNCHDYFNCESDCQKSDHQGFSRSFCRSLAINEGDAQCCYLKYKYNDRTYYNCAPLSLAQFYDIDEAIKSFKSTYSIDVKSLECTSSSYLYGSFLLLLFILF